MKKLLNIASVVFLSTVHVLFLGPLAEGASLGSKEEMDKQLRSVLDEPRVEAEYYPLLTVYEGSDVTPQEIVNIFEKETEAFLSRFSSAEESTLVRVQIVPYVIPFIRALFPNEPAEAEKAIQIHLECQRPARTRL